MFDGLAIWIEKYFLCSWILSLLCNEDDFLTIVIELYLMFLYYVLKTCEMRTKILKGNENVAILFVAVEKSSYEHLIE